MAPVEAGSEVNEDAILSTDPKAASPSRPRKRARTLNHNDLRPSIETKLSSRRSLQSLRRTATEGSTEVRPWNKEDNYTWAKTGLDVHLGLRSPKSVCRSPQGGAGGLCNSLPTSCCEGDSTPSHFESDSPTTSTDLTLLNPIPHPQSLFPHPQSRLSRQNSQTKGVDSRLPTEGKTARTRTRSKSLYTQSHKVGERYPTTSCSPPPEYNIDQVGANHSQITVGKADEQILLDNKGIGKLILRSKSTRNTSPITISENGNMSQQISTAREYRRQTYSGAQGMPSFAYRRKRIVEKIKKHWRKGIKRITRRSSTHQVLHDPIGTSRM
ncbi:hypothetical protein BU24DRAFT_421288 [Aaosphaeria arxii CBS 175.79]|uniref:Uncharacterized protein n=1 Tax=Aaosphaeria arxii CBS 175.79 TaxID=1450172 RepID=A0A6A5XZB2_9PLEO|nr:uncharacterized protein BU24DRAFT_421288 [Aaosphaeria arxii CBS 175.79]KAF2018309.1 hypothetical protein BU24DRAFT_421288 [Aaosphaeria arxii CBS 175.79]